MHQLKKIKVMIALGYKRADIIQELNTSASNFDSFLAREGTSFSKLKFSIHREIVLNLIEQGITQKEIADDPSRNIGKHFISSLKSEDLKQAKKRFEENLINKLAQFKQELTIDEAAEKLNLSANALRHIASKQGIKFKRASFSLKNQERASHFIDLKNSGMTLQQIGNKFGMTRERVRQIISKGNKIIGGLKTLKEIRSAKKEEEFREIVGKHKEQIKLLYERHYNFTEIAEMTGLYPNMLKKVFDYLVNDEFISKRALNSKPPSEETLEIRKIILESKEMNKTNQEIADQLGISLAAVTYHISRMRSEGIFIASNRSAAITDYDSMYAEKRHERKLRIKNFLDQGLNKRKIANKLDISYHTLLRFIKLYMNDE